MPKLIVNEMHCIEEFNILYNIFNYEFNIFVRKYHSLLN